MPIGAKGLCLKNTLLSLLQGMKGHSWKSRDIMGQRKCQALGVKDHAQLIGKSNIFYFKSQNKKCEVSVEN